MSKSPYLSNPNILAHPDRIVQKVELDMTAQDSYLAGSPISAEGKLANDANAIGILLYDVHKAIGGRTGVVVIFGRIKQDVAAEHSGITISAEAKAALIDITFTGDGCRMGGGGLTELPEGYPYKESVTIEWDGNTEGLTAVQNIFYKVSDDILDDETLKNSVITYYQNGSFTNKVVSEMWDSMVSYGLITENYAVLGEFCIITRADNLTVNNYVLPTAGVYFVCRNGIYTTKLSSETIHTMAPEFLPEPQTVTFTLNTESGDVTASHTGAEIAEMGKRGTVVATLDANGSTFLCRYIGGMNGAACFVSGFANDDSGYIYVFDVAADSTATAAGVIKS